MFPWPQISKIDIFFSGFGSEELFNKECCNRVHSYRRLSLHRFYFVRFSCVDAFRVWHHLNIIQYVYMNITIITFA